MYAGGGSDLNGKIVYVMLGGVHSIVCSYLINYFNSFLFFLANKKFSSVELQILLEMWHKFDLRIARHSSNKPHWGIINMIIVVTVDIIFKVLWLMLTWQITLSAKSTGNKVGKHFGIPKSTLHAKLKGTAVWNHRSKKSITTWSLLEFFFYAFKFISSY